MSGSDHDLAEGAAIVPQPVSASRWKSVFARRRPGPVADDAIRQASVAPLRQRVSRADVALVIGGIALGTASAFFPWYVFFNQEQFGIRALKFNDIPSTGPVPAGATPAGRIDAPIQATANPNAGLDQMSTGTLQDEREEDDPPPPGLAEQPFPQPIPEFHVVHIANGRAMLQDDSGLWLVQRGSELPDKSRVAAIERRGETWVVVTTENRVMTVGE